MQPDAAQGAQQRAREHRRVPILEALQGQPPSDVAATLRALIVAANGEPELAGVFSTYAADTPQIYLEIDRDKAQVLAGCHPVGLEMKNETLDSNAETDGHRGGQE